MKRVRFILIIAVTLLTLSILGSKTAFVLEPRDYTPDNLLRLHVIANSNTLADQALKRLIRNKVIESTKKLLTDVKDVTDASSIMEANIDYLTEVVNEELSRRGKDYKVAIKVEETYFPTRTYGSVTLPEGNYQAVRVILGDGNGANWWCVLFPPLCFVDSVDSVNNKSPKLMEAKANSSNMGEDTEVEVEFRLKFLDYLKKNPELIKKNLKLAKIFSFGK
ncbi:stage II sporulation protein R [Orenia metallireducens]|uniref:stage II sporulation protein R n=1 Tax=Orenia metallireducens TaxID=1413210 RepID=UPI000D05B6A3|nr:stage II sporulation protein R [Orenia metallireducens]PRX31701.1 stage II sporulation protein R [Orenia metallireducens]